MQIKSLTSRSSFSVNVGLVLMTFVILCFTIKEPACSQVAQKEADELEGKTPLGSTMTLEQIGTPFNKNGKADDPKQKYLKPLKVRAAAEPVPALKYRFRPLETELHPGSAQLRFYRATLMSAQLGNQRKKKVNDLIESGETSDELKQLVAGFRNIYEEIRMMALSEDFEIDHRWREMRGPEMFGYLLPDVQEARMLARMLALKCRLELSQGNVHEALLTIRDGFQLGSLVGNGELLVQQLVGLAIHDVMMDLVQEAMQIPSCPNLYWALATLPRPSINLARSIELELSSMNRVFYKLNDLEEHVFSEDEMQKLWTEIFGELKAFGGGGDPNDIGKTLPLLAAESARKRLLDNGFDKEKLKAMTAVQVSLIDAAREVKYWSNELSKGHLLPPHIGAKVIKGTENKFNQWLADNKLSSVGTIIAGMFFPGTSSAAFAQTRQEMALNRLMSIEAVRMHVATHQGKLPISLDELSPVPALPNPFNNKPFQYRVMNDGDAKSVIQVQAVTSPQQPMAGVNLIFEETRPEVEK